MVHLSGVGCPELGSILITITDKDSAITPEDYKCSYSNEIANQMEVGEIYGPLKVPEGYSIFKLIDKKTISHETNDTQQPDIQFIRMQIALGKMNNLINNKTIDLADKYGISLDENLLKQIELSEVNTFTYRLIGFGGKIASFPVTVPMFEWYQLFKERKELP